MRTERFLGMILGLIITGVSPTADEAKAVTENVSWLRESFSLAGERSVETQYFVLETRLVHFAADGRRSGYEIYRLHLKCVPAKLAGKRGDEYTCARFGVQTSDRAEVTIPALAGWSYLFAVNDKGMDETGQVFGIPHAKFENLRDSNGGALDLDKTYAIYNAFIDFHSFCDALATKTSSGKGIQDLSRIGQKIVHASAFSEPPVNLGSSIAPGSSFKNGEVTLTFKGLGVAQGADCAIVAVDSGDSSFKMIMKPAPNMEIRTTGASHYQADLYLDLKTKWVQKVALSELVISETAVPGPAGRIDAVAERTMTIHNVSAAEFEKAVK
jgi:hypothetical protein